MSLRHVVLVVLSKGEMTGYDISKQFDKSVGFYWETTHQQVYRALKMLSRDGLVAYKIEEQNGKPDKKIYTITALGHDELLRWLSQTSRRPPINEPFLVKLKAGLEESLPHLISELEENIESCEAKLSAYHQIESLNFNRDIPLSTTMRMHYLILKNGIAFEQYWYNWATMAKAELEDIIMSNSLDQANFD